jgi:hypothetical protein
MEAGRRVLGNRMMRKRNWANSYDLWPQDLRRLSGEEGRGRGGDERGDVLGGEGEEGADVYVVGGRFGNVCR